ncbi:hypothetical protein, conserved [Angomonas deanei]|uniref:Uncharacterized protein n=1 Tax=Angomonas deanei TaxID=59799 RepID=A0A7G2C7S6_9TRYP|nr:hypothetical protein, conserved [Angomonas deanei]
MQLLPPSKKSFKEENSEHDRYAKNRDGYNRGKDINKKDYGFLVELTASGLSAVFGERLSLLSLWMPPAVDVEGVRRINRKYNITQRMGDDAEEEYTQTFLQGVQRKIRDILHDYFAFLNLIRVLDFLVPRFVRNYVMDFLFFSPSVNEAESVTSTLFPRYFTNERFYKLERNYGTVQAVFLNNDDNNVEGNVEIRLTLHKITGNVEEEVTKKKRRRDPTVLQQLSFLLHELPSYKRSPLAKASFLVPESYFSSYYTAPTFPHPYREINPHQHLERSAYRFYYYNTPTQLPSLKQFLLSRQCPEWTYCMNSIHYPKYIRKKGNVLTRAGEAILFHHNQNVYPSLYNSVTILSSVVGALLIASGVGVCFIVAMYVLYFLQRTFGKPQPITVVRLKID